MNLKKFGKSLVCEAYDRAEKRGEKRGISQTAKAMKATGDTVSKIMRCTGLSRREIMAL